MAALVHSVLCGDTVVTYTIYIHASNEDINQSETLFDFWLVITDEPAILFSVILLCPESIVSQVLLLEYNIPAMHLGGSRTVSPE